MFQIHVMRGTALPLCGSARFTPFESGYSVRLRLIGATRQEADYKAAVSWGWRTGLCTLVTPLGMLRTLAIQPLLTMDGVYEAGHLRSGDYIVGPSGQPHKIQAWRFERVTAPIASLDVEPEAMVTTGGAFVCAATDKTPPN